MKILTEEIFVQIKARRSLVAIATKAGTQRGTGQKAPVNMFMNLGYSVFKPANSLLQKHYHGHNEPPSSPAH